MIPINKDMRTVIAMVEAMDKARLGRDTMVLALGDEERLYRGGGTVFLRQTASRSHIFSSFSMLIPSKRPACSRSC